MARTMTRSFTAIARTIVERVKTQPIGRRRLLALLPVLGVSLAASGCIATPGYGIHSYYGDPYYSSSRGNYYGSRPYYSPQRTVYVQPRRVIVKQPKRYHRVERVYRSDHRHRAYRADRDRRVHRVVRPATRAQRAIRPHPGRHEPRYFDRKDSRRQPTRPHVRGHDRPRSEARGGHRRPDRREARDRERNRERVWTVSGDQRHHGRGRR